MKTKRDDGRVWLVVLAVLALLAAAPLVWLFAADITPGYTFSSGEQNVTHTKLNNSAAGTINSTFYSGKASAGSDPNTAFEILLRDTSLDVFKKSTLSAAFLDHSALLNSRTAKTAPVVGDSLFISDSAAAGAYKQMTISNELYGGVATGVPTNGTRFPALIGGALGSLDLSNLIAAATSHTLPTNDDAFLVLRANGGIAIGQITLENMLKGLTVETSNAGSNSFLMWGANGLRQIRETNLIRSLTLAAPGTNAEFGYLEAGAFRKATGDGVRRMANAGTLGFYTIFRDVQTSGTDGGTFTTGAWRTRTINEETYDTGVGGSVAANQITLPAGTYYCRISAPGYQCNLHQIRLQNVTDATSTLFGTSERSGAGDGTATRSFIEGRFTIAASKAFEVQHQGGATKATDGFGTAGGFGGDEVYAVAEFWKED